MEGQIFQTYIITPLDLNNVQLRYGRILENKFPSIIIQEKEKDDHSNEEIFLHQDKNIENKNNHSREETSLHQNQNSQNKTQDNPINSTPIIEKPFVSIPKPPFLNDCKLTKG